MFYIACLLRCVFQFFFFFNDTATTEIYTLSLHDALPILCRGAALPVAPQLEEVCLRDPGPIGPERLDAGGELTQGPVDVTSDAVELDRHRSQLRRGDPDADSVHLPPPRMLTSKVRRRCTFEGNRRQTTIHRGCQRSGNGPHGERRSGGWLVAGSTRLSHRSPRSTTDLQPASAGRRRLLGWLPEGAQGVDARSDPTSARRPAMDRPTPRSAPKRRTFAANWDPRSAPRGR